MTIDEEIQEFLVLVMQLAMSLNYFKIKSCKEKKQLRPNQSVTSEICLVWEYTPIKVGNIYRLPMFSGERKYVLS